MTASNSNFARQAQQLTTQFSEHQQLAKKPCQNWFRSSQALADKLLNMYTDHPGATTSLLFYPNSLSASQHRNFSALLWTNLLCHTLKINKSSTQQLLCAQLCKQGFSAEFVLLLKKAHQWLWLYAMQQQQFDGRRQMQWLTRTNLPLHQYIVAFACLLPSLLTGPRAYPQTIKQLAIRVSSDALAVLSSLIEQQGLLLPGIQIDTAAISDCLVIESQAERTLVYPLHQEITQVKPRWISADHVIGMPATLKDLRIIEIEAYWQQSLPEQSRVTSPVFSVSKPPKTLLSSIALLHSPETEVDKMAVCIQQEPLFAEHLKALASQSNRQQLSVSRITHAIMIQGTEKSAFILVRHALMLRLNQHYFPLQATFVQFAELYCQTAVVLATETLGATFQEEVHTLALFAISGLFTLGPLKSLCRWQPPTGEDFQLKQLFTHPKAIQLGTLAHTLARSWQQPMRCQLAIQQLGFMPNTVKGNNIDRAFSCILGLALILAKRAFWNAKSKQPETESYIQQATKKLGIPPKNLPALQLEALCISQAYRPLQLAK